jgi:hypothetical protein
MNERMAVPAAMRALIQRINRKLRQDDQRLRTEHGWFSDLGHYYILDFKHNGGREGVRRARSAAPRPWRAERLRATGRKLELPEHLKSRDHRVNRSEIDPVPGKSGIS